MAHAGRETLPESFPEAPGWSGTAALSPDGAVHADVAVEDERRIRRPAVGDRVVIEGASTDRAWLEAGPGPGGVIGHVLQVMPQGLRIGVTGKFLGVAVSLAAVSLIAWKHLSEDQLRDGLWESWRFVKQIFPLLVLGVFIVGMIRVLIRPEWIETLAGTNSLVGNLAGVVFGVFMYFPTLVEVPIAKMFLDLGMHRGPLLAYLMSDPELSLQSILIISAIIGRKKTATYVGLVALFSAAAGLTYGAWVDGTSLFVLALWLGGFIAALAVLLFLVSRHTATPSALKGV